MMMMMMMMMTEMALETLVQYVHLTRLIDREDFIEFSCRYSSGTYITIRVDRKEAVCEMFDWIHLAQDRNQWGVLLSTR
jgi:hypothetical protein